VAERVAERVSGKELRLITGGYSCYQKIGDALDEVGVDFAKVIVHQGKNYTVQCRTYAFDGEAAYQGEGLGVKHYLRTSDGIDDATIVVWHDPPHACDLLVEHGCKAVDNDYVEETVHTLLKQIYSFFAKSGKKTRGLEEIATELNVDLRQLHYVFKIRFVEGEWRAFKSFLWDYGVVVEYLERYAKGEVDDGQEEDKAKVKRWLKKIKQFKFIAVCIVLMDLHFESKIFSKTTQSDSNIVIDFPNAKAKYKLGIESRLTSLGEVGNEHLEELATGKFKGVTLLNPPRTVPLARQKLLGFQKKIGTAMLNDFERRLPTPEIVTRLKAAFDYRDLQRFFEREDCEDEFEEWGDESLEWIVDNYFPFLSKARVTQQSLRVKVWLRENYKDFMSGGDDGESAPKLLLCGDGSVFRELFTNALAAYGENKELLHIIDYMIAFKYNQSDTERGGSEMARAKTKERASLGFDVFNDIVFVGSNCCHSHEFDFDELVQMWIRKNHRLPTLDVDASKVSQRLQSRSSSTFMGRSRNDSTSHAVAPGRAGTNEHLS
jgi:hypothetical protein